jgi:hypothetical protein
MKGLVKKWYLLAVSLILIISAVGLSATEVLAAAPPTPPLVSFIVLNGTTSYLNIEVGSTTVPGWCADLNNKITLGAPYTGRPYNYFADYYPSYVSSLPTKVTAGINWCAIDYILNNDAGATMADIQEAIWSFTPSGPIPSGFHPASAKALALENAATTYLAGHSGVFVPASGQVGIIIYYVNDCTQLIFDPYTIPTPPPPPLPEMSTFVLFGIGLAGLGGFGWLRFRKNRLAS